MRLSSARGLLGTWQSWNGKHVNVESFVSTRDIAAENDTEQQSAKWTQTRPDRPSDRQSDRKEQNNKALTFLLVSFWCIL